MKKEIIGMFKKLSKVYDDNYIVKGVARNVQAFQATDRTGLCLYKKLENMNMKNYDQLVAVIRTLFVEDNKQKRPFVLKGNFAIKFDDIVKYLVKIIQK